MAAITLDDGHQMQGFGLLSGPGTGTSDSIPVAASDGEVIIPADKVRNFGAAQIMAMVDKGGRGLTKPPMKNGRLHAAVGGLIEDPEKRSAQAATLATPQPTMATTSDIAGGAMPTPGLGYMAPTPTGPISTAAASAPAPSRAQQLVSQIPTGGETAPPPDGSQGFGLNRALAPVARVVDGLVGQANAAPVPAGGLGAVPPPATQAQVRQIDNAPANAAAIAATPPAPAPTGQIPGTVPVQPLAADAAPALGLPVGVTRTGNEFAGANVGAPGLGIGGARANPLGSMADTQAQIANIQALQPNATPGLGVIADPDAQRRTDFFTDAAQRNDLRAAQGLPTNSRARAAEIQAAQGAIASTSTNRAQLGLGLAREAGDTQRAVIQERGLDTRARAADARQAQANELNQERLGLESRRLVLDANRDDRAAAAAATEQAKAARVAQLQEQVVSGTPIQQRRAAEQLAALQGRGTTGNAPPSGYRARADGNLEPIPGGPADPNSKANKALTEDQAKSAGYAIRMEDALKTINSVATTNPGATRPGVGTAMINALPEGVANALRPEDRQRVEAAQLDALDAALTLATGAAYTKEQLQGLSRAYFAQPNDGDKTVAEKQARLNKIIETARLRAGPTGAAMADRIAASEPAPAAAAVPPQIAELQRRAANNPALAQRLKDMGY